MSDCIPGLFGRRRAHAFEARFDKGPAEITAKVTGSVATALAMIEKHRSRRYICDVCTRCGTIIMRPDKEAQG